AAFSGAPVTEDEAGRFFDRAARVHAREEEEERKEGTNSEVRRSLHGPALRDDLNLRRSIGSEVPRHPPRPTEGARIAQIAAPRLRIGAVRRPRAGAHPPGGQESPDFLPWVCSAHAT